MNCLAPPLHSGARTKVVLKPSLLDDDTGSDHGTGVLGLSMLSGQLLSAVEANHAYLPFVWLTVQNLVMTSLRCPIGIACTSPEAESTFSHGDCALSKVSQK